jgi:hypothetical protein
MPPAPYAKELCRKALFLLADERPDRIERNDLKHVWPLLEGAINLSEEPLYRSAAERSLRDAFEITEHIAERPYASAEERLQAQTIMAFAPMYWEKYFCQDRDMHEELMKKSILETRAELGRIVETTWQNRYQDFELDEQGIVNGQLSQAEVTYLLLRAGLETWPASFRE